MVGIISYWAEIFLTGSLIWAMCLILIMAVLTVWHSRISSVSGSCRFCANMSAYWAMQLQGTGLWWGALLTCTGCTGLHWGPSSRSDRFLQRKRLPWLSCIRLWLCSVQHLLLQCPRPKTEPEWEGVSPRVIPDAWGCQAAGPEPKPLPYLALLGKWQC